MVLKKIHKNNLLMIYLCFEFLKLLYRSRIYYKFSCKSIYVLLNRYSKNLIHTIQNAKVNKD